MSEAPKRIWINRVYGQHPEDWDFTDGQHLTKAQLREKVEYIRADLVEAAIKWALDVATKRDNNSVVSSTLEVIRALDPAQFIEEKKQ